MTLRYKFVLPINVILVAVLAASLVWEWRRQEATGQERLRARLDEEARFVRAAYRAFGLTDRFSSFLRDFCHAFNAEVSPEHQVALVDASGHVIAHAAEHAHYPMAPARLAQLGKGFWTTENSGENFLVRVAADGDLRVVVAESTRSLHETIRANLRSHLVWYLGLGAMLLGAVNGLMSRAVIRPIRRLKWAVREMEQGGLGVQVEGLSRDELGALGGQFNQMSRALAVQAETNRLQMEAARRVQAHLLPPVETRVGCLDLAGVCQSAGPIGGDLYDVQTLSSDRVVLLVADVSGHDVAAALHTAMIRAIVRHEAETASSPGEVLARLNDRLCRDLPEEHFATVFFGWFDPERNVLRYASAGHPPAWLRTPDGQVEPLKTTGPLLGIMPDLPAEDGEVAVAPGSRLLVYTDGLIELPGPSGGQWGDTEAASLLQASVPGTASA
ncbi:MAG TPA: SpoIIE family protein phosphatase, partial [Isosphaeraceae bacterium]|nr:SpoIIE family protein phosphatase [Isosphaeraceae bacterium]